MKMDLRKRSDGLLEPVVEADKVRVQKWKHGTILECEVKKPNDQRFHAKLICMLRFAHQNLADDAAAQLQDFETFRKSLLIMAGEVDLIPTVQGAVYVEAKSLKFGKMDGAERERLYDKLAGVVMDKILSYPCEREEFDHLVEQFRLNYMGVQI